MANPISANGGGQVVGGVMGLTVDGQAYPIASDSAKWGAGGWSATSLQGASGRVGRTEAANMPFIEVKAFLPTGMRWSDVQAIRDATVTLTCVDREITLTMADLVNQAEPDPKEMSGTLRFEGLEVTEVF
jgi:hypothetical protein